VIIILPGRDVSASLGQVHEEGCPWRQPRTYSAIETLRDGRRVDIRAQRPDDRAELLAAVGRVSPESLYRRFFAVKRGLTEQEVGYFLNIDFIDHVALVAVLLEAGRPVIVGGARYIVIEPGSAEVALAVIDQYQGLGIGQALMRHLAAIARGVGIHELIADVLPENAAMLKVFAKSGLPLTTNCESNVVHVALRLDGTV
jgi:GNAT superfamily N-acetyltransferase